ncbi:DUF2971 domain-containing protein [Pseudoalteromonas sp. BZB3]|uniref:DUF2971 domain-containing protein n=1 Tax=Pseudoalteromonas sp. BZB3 TaxID=3136670 RepID=UPI0032C47C40
MKLFKYMGLDITALKDLHLRISSRDCLNDPFEFLPTLSATRKKVEVMQSLDELPYESNDLQLNIDYMEELEGDLTKYGVVCLSENGSSNLMWSHYADDHKGVMIELESANLFDFSEEQQKVMDNEFSAASVKPIPIDYISQRIGIDIKDEYLYEYANSNFIKKFFTTKSCEWKKEQEWRYIFKFLHADKVILNAPKESIESISNSLRSYKIQFELKNCTFIVNSSGNEFNMIMVDRISKSNGLSPIFLKSVNPSCIKSIYFGCRVEVSKAREVRDTLLKANSEYGHVNFKKIDLDVETYQLRQVII